MRTVVSVLTWALLVTATSRLEAQWLEAKGAHYSLFYQSGHEKDLAFTWTVLDGAEDLMRTKYAVTLDAYHIDFYLHPAPAKEADVGRALNQCCTAGNGGMKRGTIHYLAPSAAAWKASTLTTSLGLSYDDNYHAKVMMSEYITVGHYAVQDSRGGSGGWRYYSAPEWFVQGLQEFDGMVHMTDGNRDVTRARLFAWARRNPTTFACCAPSIAISDVYNGGATFLAFLAAQ